MADFIDPTGIGSDEALGTPVLYGLTAILPSGIASDEVLGTTALLVGPVIVLPSGIASAEALGTTALLPGAVVVVAEGIAGGEALGMPSAAYLQIALVSAIASAESFGSSILVPGAVLVQPSAIDSTEAFGAHTLFSRISAALVAAQNAKVRETGLIAQIIDEQVNKWEYVSGRTIPAIFYADNGAEPTDIEYQDYRGSAGMCKLDNGNIVRVRNGDEEDINDRQIWVQTITDPTNAEQWETWAVLYSGDHFSCSIHANGSSYVVYHSRHEFGAPQDLNLAYGTVVGQDNSGLGAEVSAPTNTNNVRDGNGATYSQSVAGISHTSRAPKRIWHVDLGAAYEVTSVTLRGNQTNGDWWSQFALAVGADLDPGYSWARIEYSTDNAIWTEISATPSHTGLNPDTITHTLAAPVTARYWRVYVQGHNSSRVYPGPSIYTLEITGSLVVDPVGIYRNNVLKWTPSTGVALDFVPVRGQLDAGWVRVLRDDPFDGDQMMDLYYTRDLNSVTPSADPNDYRWPTMEVAGIKTVDGKVHRICAGNLYFNSRNLTHGKTIWQQSQPSYVDTTLTAPYPIRGIGGGSGLNVVKGQQVVKLSDDFYYLFMTESRITEIVDSSPAWIKLWTGTNVTNPSGIMFDPADPNNIQVVSRTTKRRYTIRQSDQAIIATSPVLTTHSIAGISVDPDSSSNYFILEAPWLNGSSVVSKIRKFRKSDDALLATYNLDNTKWTDIQASDDRLWLTNLQTDKIYKYSTAGVKLASYAIYYGGVRQTNPNGTAFYDGYLYYFFMNSGRILKVLESAPTRILATISTHGTPILGGTFDDTGNYLFAPNSAKNKYYKFQLVTTQVTELPEGGSNLGDLTLWIRSKDLLHWSAPVVGPGLVNPRPLAGVEESGDYAYWADNGSVWRRPMTPSVTELTDYVTAVELEVPRNNQDGQGTVSVANPAGINDAIIELADQPFKLKLGIKNTAGIFESVEFNKLFVKRITRDTDGLVNRLKVQLEDVWGRLSRPLQDIYNLVGKIEWSDWATDKKNQAYNYYFVSDTTPAVSGTSLRTKGNVLYTGWRGHNPDFTCQFSSYTGSVSLLARYIDSSNFVRIKKNNGTIYIYEIAEGTAYLIDTITITDFILGYTPSTSDTLTMRLVFKWNAYTVYFNGVQVASGSRNWRNTSPGYAGFSSSSTLYSVSDFTLTDWEYDAQLSDVIKTALALGDIHDVPVAGADTKAYSLIWGPQTDIPTAAEVLRQFLTSLKLQIAFRGGNLTVNKFTDIDPLFTLQDTIIEASQTEEPEDRVNWVSVDGNENFWLEIDVSDSRNRGRQLVAYFDLPELLTLDAVKARAQEEMRRSVEGQSPSGTIVLPFDLWRMDPITWIDNVGNSHDVRVEGFTITINQSKEPSQRMKIDTSFLADTVDD